MSSAICGSMPASIFPPPFAGDHRRVVGAECRVGHSSSMPAAAQAFASSSRSERCTARRPRRRAAGSRQGHGLDRLAHEYIDDGLLERRTEVVTPDRIGLHVRRLLIEKAHSRLQSRLKRIEIVGSGKLRGRPSLGIAHLRQLFVPGRQDKATDQRATLSNAHPPRRPPSSRASRSGSGQRMDGAACGRRCDEAANGNSICRCSDRNGE